MIEIAESSFDPANSPNHTLSIRLLPDGFCFVVASLSERRPLYFCQIAEEGKSVVQQFTEQFNKLDSLRRKYSEVSFLNDARSYTLMPSATFDEADMMTYWKFCTNGNPDGVRIVQDQLDYCDATLLHGVPKVIAERMAERFPSVKYRHRQSLLVTKAMVQNKKSGEETVGVFVGEDFFDLVVVKEGVLQMVNTFSNNNDEEFLYFTLNVLDQLKIDPYKAQFIMSGDVTEKSSVVSVFSKYVNHVQVEPKSHSGWGKAFAKSNLCQQQNILFELPQCE